MAVSFRERCASHVAVTNVGVRLRLLQQGVDQPVVEFLRAAVAQQMQALAAWLNLSETVFFLPVTDPAADGDEPALEVQDVFTLTVPELRAISQATLPAAFGATVAEPVG